MELIDKRTSSQKDGKFIATKKNLENPEKYKHPPGSHITRGEGL
jgi:hypothetical protein